jgi:2-hydroxy-6-oxonona-2,4-dienedioate hydrolase
MLDRLLYRGAPGRLRGRYRLVSGIRTYERSAGAESAATVVLVHGIGVSNRYFLPTAGRLATRCTVHAPDLPGFGRSERLGGRPTVRRLADALEAWLDAAGLERPDALVANSFGCQLVLDLAARRPERVGGLVLVGPTVDRRARSLPRQAVRLVLDVSREPLALWALQAFDYALHLSKSGPAGFVEMVRDAPEEKAPHVQAPTLVVRGSRDPIVPSRWAEELAAALPHGSLAEIPGSPHAANYAAPDDLAWLILHFLATTAGSSPEPPVELLGERAAALHSEP